MYCVLHAKLASQVRIVMAQVRVAALARTCAMN